MSAPLTKIERAFNDAKFGAWVMKSDGPIREFPNQSGRMFMPLRNPDSREAKLMRKGDQIVFWSTSSQAFPATIWAIGTITTALGHRRTSKKSKPAHIETRGIYVDWQPVPIEFREHTQIGNLKLFSRFKDAAPLKTGSLSFLTEDQFKLVQEVLQKAQELQQARPDVNSLVEIVEVHDFFEMADDAPPLRGVARKRSDTEKLAIAAVRYHYERVLGYKVVDVGAQKCGWDLTVIDQLSRKPVFHVEVKGVSIQPKSVDVFPQRATLSPDEVDYAFSSAQWRLVIVNVDEPRTRVYGAHVYSHSQFEPLARMIIPHGASSTEPSVKIPGIRARGYEFDFDTLGIVGSRLDLTGFERLRTSLFSKRKKRKKK